MKVPLWQLPSVQSFLGHVLGVLDDGACVILQLPASAPPDLVDAMRRGCGERCSHRAWVDVDLQEWDDHDWGGGTVAELSHAVAELEIHDDEPVVTPRDLASHAGDRIYCLQGVPDHRWELWGRFLSEFCVANHGRDQNDRDVFFVLADANSKLPKADIGLKIVRWEGIIDAIDCQLIHQLIRRPVATTKPLGKLLIAAIATELAGGDPNLAGELATLSLQDLLRPVEFLRRYAEETDWCSADCNNWQDGGREKFRGRDRVHSAVAAAGGIEEELSRRIWHGQLVVLYPFLEEQRIALLTKVSPLLSRIQPTDPAGQPIEIQDLELGSLAFFLRRVRAPNSTQRVVNLLKDVRHELAHLRPLSFTNLQQLLTCFDQQ